LVAGFDTYGFREDGSFPELSRVRPDDLPGAELWVAGEIVRTMDAEERERLAGQGVHLYESPQLALAAIADAALAEPGA
jgi:CRISPR-associated protein Cst2